MGILNVTPDSFSDGNLYFDRDKAVKHGLDLVKEGADILDIGGESSRPGSDRVSLEEELRRILPVISELRENTDTLLSVDTTKSEVARRALDAGANMINDISSFRFDPEMMSLAAERETPVILMHMKGTPGDMQLDPHYDSLVSEIISFLETRIQMAVDSGISPNQIIVDPGIGFGKTVAHNLEIIRRLRDFKSLEKPILIGTSRKSFIGKILALPADDRLRLEGTAATVAIAVANGADVVRVHSVKEMARVVRMADAIVRGGQ